MQLHKTDRARAELQPGVRTLGQRERSLLLLADGSKSIDDFRPFFNGDGEAIVLNLVREGFLQTLPGPQAAASIAAAAAAAIAAQLPAQPRPPAAAAVTGIPAMEPAAAPATTADAFQGKRSLATTRMFLFDLCERMFSRRDPAMATAFRDALRDAKDRDTMLAAAREMLAEIETIAGPERADAISERIAMLLPVEADAG